MPQTSTTSRAFAAFSKALSEFVTLGLDNKDSENTSELPTTQNDILSTTRHEMLVDELQDANMRAAIISYVNWQIAELQQFAMDHALPLPALSPITASSYEDVNELAKKIESAERDIAIAKETEQSQAQQAEEQEQGVDAIDMLGELARPVMPAIRGYNNLSCVEEFNHCKNTPGIADIGKALKGLGVLAGGGNVLADKPLDASALKLPKGTQTGMARVLPKKCAA